MPTPLIVVLDRDPAFLELTSLLLDGHGYRMRGVRSAADAPALIRTLQPALVLIDIRRGGTDANWTALDLVRLDPTTAHIPVVVCSIDAEYLAAKAEYFELLGISAIAKPFLTQDLICTIERALCGWGRSAAPLRAAALGE